MRRLGAFVAGWLISFLLAPSLAAQTHGGTLRLYLWDNPPSASIHEEVTISTVMPFMALFNNLVLYDQQAPLNTANTIRPELATSWTWDDSRTSLTFKLRDNVRWHDGRPFTARDVACTINTLRGEGDNGLRKNPRKSWWLNVKDIVVSGDHELTFRLGRPQASFLTFFASGYTPIYPCHVTAAEMRTRPIGTGPFKLAEFTANVSIKLARNPDYWRPGRPYIDAIHWRVISNRSTRALAFVAGEFDMTFSLDLSPALMRSVQSQSPNAACELQPSNGTADLIMNSSRAPFDDVRMRKAVALALDRKAFIDILSEGQGKIGAVMLPGPEGDWSLPAHEVDSLPGYQADVEKSRAEARRIAADLGYSAGNPLRLKLATRDIPLYREPSVILIDQLKQIHIAAELDAVDTNVWFGRLARGDYALALNLTGTGLDDPDVNFYESYACRSERNYARYCSADIDRLIDQQSLESDPVRRRSLVWEVERKLAQDFVRPIIMHYVTGFCRQPAVKGFTLHRNGIFSNWRFDELWLER